MNSTIHVKYVGKLFLFTIKTNDFQVVQQLMDEYRAATTKEYVNFGTPAAGQVY